MDIQKIYFINMDKDRERRALIEERIERFFPNIPVQRIRAVTAEEIHEYRDIYHGRIKGRLAPVDGHYPLPGLLACLLSHHLTMQTIEGDFPQQDVNCLVLEDDCVFDETVYPYIRNLKAEDIPPDWRILMHTLGWRSPLDRVAGPFYEMIRARKRSWRWYWGTHFAIFRSTQVREIREMIERDELCSIDKWLRDHVHGAYSFSKRLHIKQSNIGGSNTNPEFADGRNEDRSERFGVSNIFSRLGRLFKNIIK